MTVPIPRDDAVSVTVQCAKLRNGVNTPPSDFRSWVEEETGIWSLPMTDSVNIVYYEEDGRLEVEVGDYCLGVVTMASVGNFGGRSELFIDVDNGIRLSCPLEVSA